MAYDRYDTRNDPRDERSRWRDNRHESRGADRGGSDPRSWGGERGGDEDRGWFERAGSEIASWFGSEEDEHDRMRRDRERGSRGSWDRDQDQPRGGFFGQENDRGREERSSGRNVTPSQNRERDRGEDRGSYRPITGDYSRSEQMFAASGTPRGGFGRGDDDRSEFERSQSPWGRDEYRRTSQATPRSGHPHDPHYHDWRERQMAELDRDYQEYCREHQSKFESEFGGWRERRQSKRQMFGQIREHMEVVDKDEQHLGTVDKVAGDRLILTKSDPASGGVHHSLGCSEIDRVDGDRVILDCTAEQAKERWRDESGGRALFESEDQGETGPHMLDKSFPGTYR